MGWLKFFFIKLLDGYLGNITHLHFKASLFKTLGDSYVFFLKLWFFHDEGAESDKN